MTGASKTLGLARVRFLLRIARVKPRHVLLPFGMSLVSGALGAVGFGLVVPLANGLANRSFGFAAQLPVLGRFIRQSDVERSLPSAFLVLVAAIVVCSLANIVLKYFANIYVHRRNSFIDESVKEHVLIRVLSFSRRFFDERNQGSTTRIVGHSNSLVALFGAIQGLLNASCQLVARLTLILFLSWRMALSVGVLLFLLDRLLGRLRAHLKHLSRQSAEVRKDLSRQVFNMFASIDLVKACAKEDAIRGRYRDKRGELRKLDQRAAVISALSSPIQDSARLLTLAALVIVVMWTIGLGETHRMAQMLVLFWVGQSALPYFNEITDARMRMIRAWPDVEELVDVLENTDDYVLRAGKREFPGLTDKIEFRSVSFQYVEGSDALRDFDLVLPRGKVTALAGKTGSGKSTVAKLLVRLYNCRPDEIFVDGIDIREFSLSSLQGEIAYVGQSVAIFDDTVRENVCFGAPPRSDEQVWDALRRVALSETIARRAEGLDTRLGDHGVQLSGGERQRLAIARALLRDAQILVMDEATSALDSLTEQAILREVAASGQGQTVLVIAHRLSTIRDADSIAVMEGGRVVEQGTFKELLALRGHFHAAWEVSSRDEEERPRAPSRREAPDAKP